MNRSIRTRTLAGAAVSATLLAASVGPFAVPFGAAGAAVRRTASKSPSRPPATAKAVKPASASASKPTGAVAATVNWSVNKPITGWDRTPDDSWPAPGKAIAIEARASFIDVRKTPSVGAPGLRFAKGLSSTGPVTFLALQDFGEWIQVAIPVRPNGTVGWVQGKDVSRIAIPNRMVVELSTNTLVMENDGVVSGRYPISSGTGGTPTPTGLFYLRELVVEADPTGPYGPYVFGLSGYSEVLTSFDGGEGAIGLHGTNRPDAIGSSVSHGCIRLSNDSIRELTKFLPLGTPVEIVEHLADLPTKRRANAEPDPAPADAVAGVAAPVVIDFPTESPKLPRQRLEDVDVADVTPTA